MAVRMPATPPNLLDLYMDRISPQRYFELSTSAIKLADEKYYHWDKLRRLAPPSGLTLEEWWLKLKLSRIAQAKPVPLKDTKGLHFQFSMVDPIPERLNEIDMQGGGRLQSITSALNSNERDRYIVSSLIEEAISSSQLEGAATTGEVAREMIRSQRRPHDRSEQMILNNFLTMQAIQELKSRDLSIEMLLDLHKKITSETLDDPVMAGRVRPADRQIDVRDDYGQVFHIPPPANELAARMQEMCRFANGQTPDYFVHPVLRAIILHFWLAYDHPFVDGNGRTARALFYWSMLRHGYWLFEFISISEVILRAPMQYARAYLYTETDGNDLTYFLHYHLMVIHRALEHLRQFIRRKSERQAKLEIELRGMRSLNYRQRALVSHALRHPHQDYTVESHRMSHNVVYETARSDLLELATRGLLDKRKEGKTWHFRPNPNLEEALEGKSA